MKKRFLYFALVLLVLISNFSFSVNADDNVFVAELSGEEYGVIGEKYVLNLTFTGFSDEEFLGATAFIDYDAEILEIDSTYLGIISGDVVLEDYNAETYALYNGEEGWEFWGKDESEESKGVFKAHVVSTSLKSLNSESVTCFIEFNVKEGVTPCETEIKIDTDSELIGVFGESSIESKLGSGSSITVSVVESIPSFIKELTLTEESTYTLTYKDDVGFKAVYGFKEKTTVEEFLSNFIYEENNLKVYNGDEELASDKTLFTGAEVKLYNKDEVLDSAVIILKGDIDSNGVITSTDYIRIKSYFLSMFMLSDVSFIASDIDNNEKITSTDYLKLKSYFLGFSDSL